METITAGGFWGRSIMENVLGGLWTGLALDWLGSGLASARQGHCLMGGIILAELKAGLSSCTSVCHFVVSPPDLLSSYNTIHANLYCMRRKKLFLCCRLL
jgi:hypothetical protein